MNAQPHDGLAAAHFERVHSEFSTVIEAEARQSLKNRAQTAGTMAREAFLQFHDATGETVDEWVRHLERRGAFEWVAEVAAILRSRLES